MTHFESIPINTALGMTLTRTDGSAEVRVPLQEWFAQEGGVVHGGIITTIADTAAIYAVFPGFERGPAMTSIDLKVDFLRPAMLSGEALVARSRLVKKGRRVAVCAVDVHQGSSHVATGLFTYLILETTDR